MIINLDRSSVCMGDDCMSHKIKRNYSDGIDLYDFMSDLTGYVPFMKNVVWAIVSLNSKKRILGYLETDGFKSNIHIKENLLLKDMFENQMEPLDVDCIYYYRGSIRWDSSQKKSMEHLSLLDQVKFFRNDLD